MNFSQFSVRSLLWQWRIVFIATPMVSAVIILIRFLGLLQPLELFAYDVFVSQKFIESQDERIVIVGIGEQDVEKIGTALISDEIYANLLEKLLEQEPSAIALDIDRDVPILPGTDKLEDIFKSSERIIGIEKMVGNTRERRVKPNPILKANNQIGFNDVILDEDNKIRRALIALPEQKAFSLGMYSALLYLADENINLTVTEENNYWQLKDIIFTPLESNDGGYANADSGGYQILLNYRGNSEHFATVSLFDVLDDQLPSNWGKDKIICVP